MTILDIQESFADALAMERESILSDDDEDDEDDESHLPPHKRSNYAESMAEAADWRRKEKREEGQ